MAALPASIPNPTNYATCILCGDVNENNWESELDDLLVCVESSCDKKHRVMCRTCMTTSHKKRDHKLDTEPLQFVDYETWLDMTRIKKAKPSGPIKSTVTLAAKGTVFHGGAAGVGAYALADKAVLQLIKQVPGKCTKEQLVKYGQGIVNGIAKSDASKKAVLEGMAKSNVAVAGIMFAIEVGWNAVQCAYDDDISYSEMMRRNEKAGVAHGCGFVGSLIGGGIGLMFGPWGALAGSAIGGTIADFSARQLFEKSNPNERAKHIETAIVRFGYGNAKLDDLLEDVENFNLDKLKERYHLYAYDNHPDGRLANAGRTDKEKQQIWDEYYSCYNTLLVLCKQRDEKLRKKGQ